MKFHLFVFAAFILIATSCKKNDDNNASKTDDISIAKYGYLTDQQPGNTMHIEIAFKDCAGNIIRSLDSARIENVNIGEQTVVNYQPVYPQAWIRLDSCSPSMNQCNLTIYWHREEDNKSFNKTFTITPQNWQ